MSYIGEISIKKRTLDKLKHYDLHFSIISTESELYYLKKFHNQPSLLLKKLWSPTPEVIEEKTGIIEEISSREDLQTISELVVPKNLVIAGGEPCGFSIDEVPNSENLGVVLNDGSVSMEKKINLVSKVGKVVEKTVNLDKDFFFTDLHEFNFLVDDKDDIFAIDLDSSKIDSNHPIASKYLAIDRKLKNVNKYNVTYSGLAYPDKNSEKYCYNMIVLNLMAGGKAHRIKIDEFYNYLVYLDSLGVGEKVLDPLSRMYTEQDNILITDIENNIPTDKDISFKTYKKTLK